jgi:hypothetical protein
MRSSSTQASADRSPSLLSAAPCTAVVRNDAFELDGGLRSSLAVAAPQPSAVSCTVAVCNHAHELAEGDVLELDRALRSSLAVTAPQPSTAPFTADVPNQAEELAGGDALELDEASTAPSAAPPRKDVVFFPAPAHL